MIRTALVLVSALVVAIYAIRVAVVEAFAAKRPQVAVAVWAGHPAVLFETGLSEVGERAVAGKSIDKALVDKLVSGSVKAPLAPQPFLVRGVDAQVSGNLPLALQSYLAARQRSPRFIAAHYFLADFYLRTGQAKEGLAEISALARLVPQSLPQIAPYLAAYARTPSAAPQVKQILQSHPSLEMVLLNELAADAANARLIGYLWSGRGGEEARPWQSRLVNQLVEARKYGEARTTWAKFTSIAVEPDQLFDPEFTRQALPPFGWTLAAGPSGIAEPQGGGRLHVIFYGRDDLVLASQLLTLPPGRYRLSMDLKLETAAGKSLSWTIRCLPSSTAVASIRIGRSGAAAATFNVGGGECAAQKLELVGDAPEFPELAEATIGRLRLQRDGGQ